MSIATQTAPVVEETEVMTGTLLFDMSWQNPV